MDKIRHDDIVLAVDEGGHDCDLLRSCPAVIGHAVDCEAVDLRLIVVLLRSRLDLPVVDEAARRLRHPVAIVAPVEAVHHQRHVASPTLLRRILLHVCELHFNEPISILTFAINPD